MFIYILFFLTFNLNSGLSLSKKPKIFFQNPTKLFQEKNDSTFTENSNSSSSTEENNNNFNMLFSIKAINSNQAEKKNPDTPLNLSNNSSEENHKFENEEENNILAPNNSPLAQNNSPISINRYPKNSNLKKFNLDNFFSKKISPKNKSLSQENILLKISDNKQRNNSQILNKIDYSSNLNNSNSKEKKLENEIEDLKKQILNLKNEKNILNNENNFLKENNRDKSPIKEKKKKCLTSCLKICTSSSKDTKDKIQSTNNKNKIFNFESKNSSEEEDIKNSSDQPTPSPSKNSLIQTKKEFKITLYPAFEIEKENNKNFKK